MAIKFKYDATGVVIPQNQARQKFGQSLVLNQQKYANDQRQNIFDMQKQGMQNQFQWNLQAGNNLEKGKQALAELNAQQTFGAKTQQTAIGAQTARDKLLADERAQQQAMQRQAQLTAQSRADDFNGIKSGAFKGKIASDIEAAHALTTQINLKGQRGELDAGQVADAHAQNQAALNELRNGRIAVPSMTEQSNQNMQYWNPKTRAWIDKAAADQLPPNEVQSYLNGHLMPGPPQQATAGSYYSDPKNNKEYKQDYANANNEIKTEIEDGGKAMSPEEIHAEASRRMELDYNNKQKNIAAWQAQGMPAMSPAAPVGQAPVQGGTPAPTQAELASPPPAVALPNPQAIANTLGLPPNARQSPIDIGMALTPAHPNYKAPPTPTDQVDAKGFVIMSDGSKVHPAEVQNAKKGFQTDVNRLQNPDGSPIEPSSRAYANELGAGAAQAAQPQAGLPPQAQAMVPPVAQGVPPNAAQPVAGQAAPQPEVFGQDHLGEYKDATRINWSEQPVGTRMMKADGKMYVKTARFKWEPWVEGQPVTPQQAGPPLVMPPGKKAYGYFGKKDAAEQVAATQQAATQEAAYQAAFNPKAVPPQQAGQPAPLPQAEQPATAWLSQAASEAAAASASASGQPVMEPTQSPPTAAVTTPPVTPPTVAPTAPPAAQTPANAPAAITPPVTAVAAKPQASQSIQDTINEANTTFESGTPEQKVALREKLANSETLSGLMAQATSGNEDARKALLSAKSEYSPSELVASAKRKAKGNASDAIGAVRDLQDMKKAGKIDDQDYTSAIVENSGKTAKQVYEGVITKSGKSGRLNIHNEETKANALNAIWDEMGMYDSRSHVRAFQKTPTMDDVITHAATKGKMSRAAAEEWVYSQILARKYAENVQKQFEDSITGNAESLREKKQKEKQDAWSPSKK